MNLNHKSYASADVKVINENEGIVSAFVAVIGNLDSVGDIIQPGAFDAGLKKRIPKGVWSHDWDKPISKTLEIYEVPAGDPRLPFDLQAKGLGALYVETQFNLKTQLGRDAFENVKFYGEESEWSIGYRTIREQYDSKQKANLLYEVELYEYSPVLFGANPMTSTASIKAETIEGEMIIKIDGVDEDRVQLVKDAVMEILSKDDVSDDDQLLSEADDKVESDEVIETDDLSSEDSEEKIDIVGESIDVSVEDDVEVAELSESEEKEEVVSVEEKTDGGGGSPRANREEAVVIEEKTVEGKIKEKALVGSYEERYSKLSDAIEAEYREIGHAYVYATFDDKVVCYLYEYESGEHGYWSISYQMDSDGNIMFGEPEAVNVVEVTVLKNALNEAIKFGMTDYAKSAIQEIFESLEKPVSVKANRIEDNDIKDELEAVEINTKIQEADIVRFEMDEEMYSGSVEYVMIEGYFGIPGSRFYTQATMDDPVLLIRIWEDGEETELLTGRKLSEVEIVEPSDDMPDDGEDDDNGDDSIPSDDVILSASSDATSEKEFANPDELRKSLADFYALIQS